MTSLFVVLGAWVVWLALGWFAARVVLIAFEAQFGEGNGVDLAPLAFLTGPIGIVVNVVTSIGGNAVIAKSDWKAALGLQEVELRAAYGYYPNDSRRSKFAKFFLVGVKGLPDFDKNTEDYVGKYPILADSIRFERLTGIR